MSDAHPRQARLCLAGVPIQQPAEVKRIDARGSDGFNVMFPYLPEGLDDVVDKVIPELQRRGLYRMSYTGCTLRENLGLPKRVRCGVGH